MTCELLKDKSATLKIPDILNFRKPTNSDSVSCPSTFVFFFFLQTGTNATLLFIFLFFFNFAKTKSSFFFFVFCYFAVFVWGGFFSP